MKKMLKKFGCFLSDVGIIIFFGIFGDPSQSRKGGAKRITLLVIASAIATALLCFFPKLAEQMVDKPGKFEKLILPAYIFTLVMISLCKTFPARMQK
jgi:hypothetical protein